MPAPSEYESRSSRLNSPSDAPNPTLRAIATCTDFLHLFGSDPAKAFDHCTPDARWHFNRAKPENPAGMGKDDMVKLRGNLFQQLSMRIDDAWAKEDGRRVAIECASDGVLKHGSVYQNSYEFHFRLDASGKIQWIKEHADSVYAREVIGQDAAKSAEAR